MINSIAKQEAYKNLVDSGDSKKLETLIYNELVKQPQTIVYFKESLNLKHPTCTSRLSELERKGMVYKIKKIYIGKKSYSLYGAETNPEQFKIRAIKAYKHKHLLWVQRGLNQGWITNQIELNKDVEYDISGGGYNP